MSKPKPDLELVTIDLGTLTTVTGGKSGDPLINDLSYLASSIKDLTKQTSGFSSSSMLLLCMLALQRNNASQTNVVYVQRPRYW